MVDLYDLDNEKLETLHRAEKLIAENKKSLERKLDSASTKEERLKYQFHLKKIKNKEIKINSEIYNLQSVLY